MHARARLLTAGAVAAGIALVPGVALAAGGGYGPTNGTGAPDSPGGFSVKAGTTAIDSTGGGKLSVSLPGAASATAVSATINAPVGALPVGAQIEATAPDLSGVTTGLSGAGFPGYKAVSGIGVKVFNADGTPMTGTFAHPVTITLSAAGLGAAGEKVIVFTGATAASAVPATVSNGKVTFTIDQDPNLAVVEPIAATTGTVSNATATHTGLPFTGEEVAIVGLVVVGVGGLAMARRRATR